VCLLASGCTGTIGGKQSHEFHLLSDVGEDRLLHCSACNEVFNEELLETGSGVHVVQGGSSSSSTTTSNSIPKCIQCGSPELSGSTSIEVLLNFFPNISLTLTDISDKCCDIIF